MTKPVPSSLRLSDPCKQTLHLAVLVHPEALLPAIEVDQASRLLCLALQSLGLVETYSI